MSRSERQVVRDMVRFRRRLVFSMPLSLLVLLAACADEEIVAEAVIPRVEVIEIGDPELGGLRELPARIEASERAELSFRLSGKLQTVTVKEGDPIEMGQLLAQLDQAVFHTRVAETEAAFRRAEADFERANQLIDDGHITRREYDHIRSRFRQTQAQFDKARVDLGYTTLLAPFNGVVAQRFVENFEEVDRGEPIFALRSVDMVDVKFDVPEKVVLLVQEIPPGQEDPIKVTARFEAAPGVDFPLTFREAASRGDTRTRTFETTYMMPQPDELNVLPGMTASVTIDMPRLAGAVYLVPQRAVFADVSMSPHVWILDRADMRVTARPVRVGRMQGTDIEIVEGLSAGDWLITSPSNFLLDGQVVQIAANPNDNPA